MVTDALAIPVIGDDDGDKGMLLSSHWTDKHYL